tara:strand:- start:435 stop:1610 length:1176 start_codon:yes stop_codon:yes gene_type:complete
MVSRYQIDKEIKQSVAKKIEALRDHVAAMIDGDDRFRHFGPAEPMMAMGEGAPAGAFQIFIDQSQVEITGDRAKFSIARNKKTGMPDEIKPVSGTWASKEKLLKTVLAQDLGGLEFNEAPRKILDKLQQNFSKAMKGTEAVPGKYYEARSAVLELEGVGEARINLGKSRFTVQAPGVSLTGTRNQNGVQRFASVDPTPNQIAFLKALDKVDPKDIIFRTPAEEAAHNAVLKASEIGAHINEKLLPDLAERGFYDKESGELSKAMKTDFRDGESRLIAIEIDQDLNISIQNTAGGRGKKHAIGMERQENGEYALHSGMRSIDALAVLEDFESHLALYGSGSLKFRPMRGQQEVPLSTWVSAGLRDYEVSKPSVRHSHTQEARNIVGLPENDL